ncbi:MAG: asparagine synthase (glutamine-hydrolyzing) [Alphaproteobacteria bacterium]|nr:MAG: asparagine synthase (glutamine-hydrolyzing) [Alphaproteobacteria bacterium]
MCGISGIIRLSKDLDTDTLRSLGTRMSDQLTHRGPDDSGHWIDSDQGIVLGQRRLSILDLSAKGHQPMVSADERHIIVFNGEIYNFQDIRKKLEHTGHIFNGHSDTEVLLSAIQYWGLDKTLKLIHGMFAFALWDRRNKTLTLARDHLGKKPLYFGQTGKDFVFASELKAIVALPNFNKKLDRNALCLFMRHNYIPAPWSIYDNIFKLTPGSVITLDFSKALPQGRAILDNVKRYWSVHDIAHQGQNNLYTGSFDEACDSLEEMLKKAVSERMIADVPLGAFLSGGVDSSLIVALMQAQSDKKVKTYAIGFEEAAFNETPHAEAVARHIGTDHTTFIVTANETRDVIPSLPDVYDEPFSDMSQIPTLHVCRLARQNAVVALSGDGGDESFAGYSRYVQAQSLAGRILNIPQIVRQPLGTLIRLLPPHLWDIALSPARGILKKSTGHDITGHRLHIASSFLKANTYDDLYRQIVSHWADPASIVKGGEELYSPMTDPALTPRLGDHIHDSMLYDTMAYLPDDILVKVDRASMAHGLEVRAPLLNKDIIEFAWSLPLSYKYETGNSKRILKSILGRHVPTSITDRPKQGFGVPMGEWLRGPLRDWAESLLSEQALAKHDLFHPDPIRKIWQEHLTGQRDWNYYLWDVLMAQAWAERWSPSN